MLFHFNLTIFDIFLLLLLIGFGLFVVITSFYYFIKNKTKYRWIKLFWALQTTVFLSTVVTGFTSGVTVTTQLIALILPLSSLAIGMVSAMSRSREMELMHKLEEHFNGQLEEWVNQQIRDLRNED